MIHYRSALDITQQLYEAMGGERGDFPFAAIEANLSEYPGQTSAWHWHDYPELAYVAEGAVTLFTPRDTFVLEAGEGCFVNADVLHMNRMAVSPGRLRVIQFDASLLSVSPKIVQKYVRPLTHSAGVECIRLRPQTAAACEILEQIRAVFETAAAEPAGFEMEIVALLCRLWRLLFCVSGVDSTATETLTEDQTRRIKAMLSCIHSRCDEPLTAQDIAASAGLSLREAHRTFRRVLDTTPGAYLQQYRLRTASRLLRESSKPITEIALNCGFSSPNYFCSAFKAAMGKSPREYRNGR
ncbi:MAG: AraC family transcriptional regulator [Clostridia bacterium]|nr:AraC family transcriptional regulator [Clostridia bacterium]